MAVVVLVGAGLLVRSFGRLVRVDPGFDTTGRYTARVALPFSSAALAASAVPATRAASIDPADAIRTEG